MSNRNNDLSTAAMDRQMDKLINRALCESKPTATPARPSAMYSSVDLRTAKPAAVEHMGFAAALTPGEVLARLTR